MRSKPVPLPALLLFTALSISGCSTKAWYEGMRFSAQNNCRRQAPGEIESCLARVNTMTYEAYEQGRSAQNK